MNDFWRDRPTLITGATGLLGGYLVPRLLARGADVVCIVRDQSPQSQLARSGLLGRCNVVRGDVMDQPLLERVIGEYEIDTLFHLAAQTIVPIANRNPISTFQTNIRGTWTVLEAARRCGITRQIIVASSDKAYGQPDHLPCDEQAPLNARHPYDVSKACADMIAQMYAHTYDLPVAVTRCGNLFGGGDLNFNRLVPGTIRSVLRGQRPVVRSDGSPVRDYLYADDAAAAYMLLAQRMADDAALHGQAFNFADEHPLTVSDMVSAIVRQMGSDLIPRIVGEASCEIPQQALCAALVRETLQWQPLYTRQQAVDATIKWYRAYFGERDQRMVAEPEHSDDPVTAMVKDPGHA